VEPAQQAVLPLPVAQLPLVDLQHVLQHAEEHEAVRLRLVHDQDINRDPAGSAPAADAERRAQDHVRLQVPVVALHELGRFDLHVREVDARHGPDGEQLEQVADVAGVLQEHLQAVLRELADEPPQALSVHPHAPRVSAPSRSCLTPRSRGCPPAGSRFGGSSAVSVRDRVASA
jgi:hypothetical protein